MNEQDFENLLSMAKSNDADNIRLAISIAENSDLSTLDKCTIINTGQNMFLNLMRFELMKKSIHPFKNK